MWAKDKTESKVGGEAEQYVPEFSWKCGITVNTHLGYIN